MSEPDSVTMEEVIDALRKLLAYDLETDILLASTRAKPVKGREVDKDVSQREKRSSRPESSSGL